MPDFYETPLESSCADVVVVEPTSPNVIAYVSPDHIDMPMFLLNLHYPLLPLSATVCATDYHDV